jgi:hypothetical protein
MWYIFVVRIGSKRADWCKAVMLILLLNSNYSADGKSGQAMPLQVIYKQLVTIAQTVESGACALLLVA